MARHIRGNATCAIARTVDVLRDPWAFVILREAFDGVTRFADFHSNLGIATDVLTERLHSLLSAGIMRRERYTDPGRRARFSYHLTSAGSQLKYVLAALQQWGDAHLPVECGPTVERVHQATGAPVQVAFVDTGGHPVGIDDVTFRRTTAYPTHLPRVSK